LEEEKEVEKEKEEQSMGMSLGHEQHSSFEYAVDHFGVSMESPYLGKFTGSTRSTKKVHPEARIN